MIDFFAEWLAATPGTVDVGGFLQYGAVGLIAALGIVFFRLAYKRESDRSDRIEADAKTDRIEALVKSDKASQRYDELVEKILPVMLETALAAKQNMELLKEVNEKIVPLLNEIERQNRGRGPNG